MRKQEGTLAYLAPEGRHVYSTRDTPILKAPEGRHVCFRSSGASMTDELYGTTIVVPYSP